MRFPSPHVRASSGVKTSDLTGRLALQTLRWTARFSEVFHLFPSRFYCVGCERISRGGKTLGLTLSVREERVDAVRVGGTPGEKARVTSRVTRQGTEGNAGRTGQSSRPRGPPPPPVEARDAVGSLITVGFCAPYWGDRNVFKSPLSYGNPPALGIELTEVASSTRVHYSLRMLREEGAPAPVGTCE